MHATRLLIVVLLTAGPALAAEPSVDKLIEQLGDDEFEKRDEAERALIKVGEKAIPALREAARKHADVDVRDRAAVLARKIEKAARGEIAHFGPNYGYWLNRVAFTPDGKQAVAAGGAVILYELPGGKEVHRCLERTYARPALALTRDGKHFVTGHQYDSAVRLGEVQTGREIRVFEGHTPATGVWAVALSPDEKRLVTGGTDKTLRLWDVGTGAEVRRFPGVADHVRSADFAPDGRRVVSGHWGPGSGFLVRLWDVDGRELRSLKGHTDAVTAALFTPDGKQVVSAGMDGRVFVWDAESGRELRSMKHDGGAGGAALSPDGKRLLTAGFGDKMVRLWDVSTGRELRHFEGHPGRVLGVAFSSDGKRALSSDSQCMVYLWQMPE